MASHYCKQCGATGNPERFHRGSGLAMLATWTPAIIAFWVWVAWFASVLESTEIVLWRLGWVAFFSIPGAIYSFWRHASAFDGCKVCHSQQIIPVDSPIAKERLAHA